MVGRLAKVQFAAALLASCLGLASARDVNCACGYLDPVTKHLWTDTTIIYFNETDASELSTNPDFVDLAFENLYEPGFTTTYRQGASRENIALDGTGALALTVDPSTKDHLVVGAGIRTTRQDIQYGSFRAALQPAQPELMSSGTALSMYYQYNASQNIEIDLVNGNKASSNAFFRGSLPKGSLRTSNYTFANVSESTYEVNEWRFDWTPEIINYSTELNASVTYSALHKTHQLPSVPGAFYVKHWSTGDPDLSQGPPLHDAKAWVGYIRIFYNSTITSAHDVFGSQCEILRQDVCSTDDHTLRSSSEFNADSAKRWELVTPKYKAPNWSIWGVAISGTILGLLIVHAIVRRLIRHFSIPKSERPVHPGAYTYKIDRFALHGELTREMIKEKKRTEKEEKKSVARGESPVFMTREIDPDAASISSYATTVEPDGNSVRGFRSLASNKNSKVIAQALPTMYYSRPGRAQDTSIGNQRTSRLQEVTNRDDEYDDEEDDEEDDMLSSQPGSPHSSDSQGENETDNAYFNPARRPSDDDATDTESVVAFRAAVQGLPNERKKSLFRNLEVKRPGQKFWSRFFSGATSKTEEIQAAVIQTSSRFDYLDGLRGLCCVLVSLLHFFLTFYPGFIDNESADHYKFVKYIRYIFTPFFFDSSFIIGVFFILSSRLIGARYLKTGHLQDLAGSIFRRLPRLAFPILTAVALEYFLIGVGAIEYLQYLASITWSTWPYAVEFVNVGWFINEYLALLFVSPPEVPKIIYNYCTGVLWTIPVSIQGSWLIFLGVIVIREIKTPWKRFGYYSFCVLSSWYAYSWGSYFWVGLAISDLDATYKYKTWGVKKWRSWMIVLFLWIVVLLSITPIWVQQVSDFLFPLYESAIHPDLSTGLAIGQTDRYVYPAYNLPQVYALFAATGVMLLVDFSSTLQAIFRLKPLRALGFYSYSIYLLHGVIFWSWGSWLCVMLAKQSVPYWANILVVFLTSYALLAFTVYLWTPFSDVFSGYAGNALWRQAQGRSFFATIG